jgi:hypothetical protein
LVDLFASEYGWSADETMNKPLDQIPQLIHAILHRRGVRVFRKTPQVDQSAPRLADRVKHVFESLTPPQE